VNHPAKKQRRLKTARQESPTWESQHLSLLSGQACRNLLYKMGSAAKDFEVFQRGNMAENPQETALPGTRSPMMHIKY
jgi:hypothetical protein